MEGVKNLQLNHFNRLPDDIVLFIFNKLWKAEWLCRCSVVSKRFGSLIPHVRNLAVIAPHYIPKWLQEGEESQATSIFKFLLGLRKIISLYLELPCYHKDDWGGTRVPIIKWKVTRFNTNVECFTFLMASAVIKVNPPLSDDEEEEEEDEEEEEEDEDDDEETEEEVEPWMTGDELCHRIKMALGCFDDACSRLRIVLDTIEGQKMIQSITITDIMQQGKIVVAGNRIAELRDLERAERSMPTVESGEVDLLLKHGSIQVVHVPKSGMVLGRVTLISLKQVNAGGNDDGDDIADDDILAGYFDGDENGVLGEAVKEMLTTHKYRLSTTRISDPIIEIGGPEDQ
ncbi:F-box protein AUF2-like [Actinidia eriantha]|uniref:F-box protein AUF2-like n=1 Tax=Actinidia eriantha TaxID=165200 RepID=UPI002584E54B|nr:F-box protein AUF2-like [Actinidia eriantha]XP_057484302.1 F-box protein AUF2-like [Actinidia eriantha]XP_057484303.1 F-box protein AUF2-like [Actinidia eriantha]XP_057484304.1 F-box protein AUF2-like [Actinidia eriantha]XP_057484305.1 F-box protein AUF2-like [Actinidia eriantha]XP_057484306.1 F-box protein AUF2-like [Actinidia eriantha]XP_057484307.1 F-box protein AUF2-like [Actinidia eriantha]XP_057484308.1 F-box protein AUF2-like [Actinidia eriantha]XP_057484309.1 F-box protein AUF2-l